MKILQKTLVSFFLCAPLYCVAQTQTTFEVISGSTQFGDWQTGTNATGYAGNFSDYSTSGSAGRAGSLNHEGLIDGNGDIFSTVDGNPIDGGNNLGAYTWISDGADGGTAGLSADLTTIGDSARFQFSYFFLGVNDNIGTYDLDFTLFEFGLHNGNLASDAFGGTASSDAFLLAGIPTSVTAAADGSDVTGTFDLEAHNEDTIQVIDGSNTGDLGTAITTLETGLTIDSIGRNGELSANTDAAGHGDGHVYLFDVIFTAATATTFDITYVIHEYTGEHTRLDTAASPTNIAFVQTHSGTSAGVTHGLDNVDDLNFGIGFRALDTSVPISGASFDSFAPLSTAIPEPSSFLLLTVGGLTLLGRRSRKA